MSALALEMANCNLIRHRFLNLLTERRVAIARHTLAAWDGETAEIINSNLEQARSILNQIADTAATAGYAELGITAQHCESQIIAHLEGPYADLAVCPGEIIWFVDTLVEACDNIAE